jgi:hypothetical protein
MNIIRFVTMNNATIRRAMLALAMVCCALPVSAGSPKHSADLDATTGGNVHVVISYGQKANDANIKKILSAGGFVQRQMDQVHAVAATIPIPALSALESDLTVKYISSDCPIHSTLDYATAAVNDNVAFQSGFAGTGSRSVEPIHGEALRRRKNRAGQSARKRIPIRAQRRPAK